MAGDRVAVYRFWLQPDRVGAKPVTPELDLKAKKAAAVILAEAGHAHQGVRRKDVPKWVQSEHARTRRDPGLLENPKSRCEGEGKEAADDCALQLAKVPRGVVSHELRPDNREDNTGTWAGHEDGVHCRQRPWNVVLVPGEADQHDQNEGQADECVPARRRGSSARERAGTHGTGRGVSPLLVGARTCAVRAREQGTA